MAEGVTKLADRSQEAAKQITEVIESTGRVIREGTSISDRASEAMSKIMASVENATELIESSSGVTERQAEDSKRVTKSTESLGPWRRALANGISRP